MTASFFYTQSEYPILSTLLCVPLVGAAFSLLIRQRTLLRLFALTITGANLLVSLPLYGAFNRTCWQFQFVEHRSWLPALKLEYVVGVDGISAVLVLLTTVLMPLCVLCSWREIKSQLNEFVVVVLLMEAALIGVFISLNLVLFYLFWEGMLIPMYLLIALWGGQRRDYAAIKFFLYTIGGSIFLLLGLLVLYIGTGTWSLPELFEHRLERQMQMLVFVCCSICFAVKTPLYPLHTWLPAAHVEAPTAGSVILASILLKMGCYGFLRFCIGLAPQAAQDVSPFMIILALIAVILGGCLALGQQDFKRLVAYSSVAHMGFVVLGIFLLTPRGIQAGVLQMVNHGISTGALFICIGMLYERTQSRLLSDNSALGSTMPRFVTLFTVAAFSSFGFPGTNGFIGEFLIVITAFEKSPFIGMGAVTGVLIAAAYMLRAVQKVIWADSPGHHTQPLGSHGMIFDIDAREVFVLAVLCFFIVLIGLHPSVVLDMTAATANTLVHRLGG